MTRIDAYLDPAALIAATQKHNAGDPLHSNRQVRAKQTEAPRHYSATGYGRKIQTSYMVWINGRWRRVYAYCFSNAASLYIGDFSDPTFVTIY